MDLLEAAAAGGGLYALIRFFVLPRLRQNFDRIRADRLSSRLMAMLFLEIAQSACLVVTLSLAAVVALVWAAPLVVGAASEGVLAEAFSGLREIHHWAESLEKWWGIAAIAVLSCALWLSLRSEAVRASRRAFEAAVEKLKAEAEAGLLPELDPTPEMRLVDSAAQARQQRIAEILADAQDGGPDAGAGRNAELVRLRREIEQLRDNYLQLDMLRRLDFGSVLAPYRRAPETWSQKLAALFLSPALFRSLSRGTKTLSVASLALLVPALVAVAKDGIAATAEHATVRVHDLILESRLRDAEVAWQNSLPAQSQQQRQLTADDEKLIDQLAQQFQQYVQHQYAPVYRTATAAGQEIHRMATRQAILEGFASARPELLTVEGGTRTADKPAADAASLVQSVAEASRQEATPHRYFREALSERARQASPDSWDEFRAKALAALAEARPGATSEDIAGRIFVEATNAVPGHIIGDETVFHSLATKLVQPGDIAEHGARLLRLDVLEFLSRLVARKAVPTPSTELSAPARVPLHDDETHSAMTTAAERLATRLQDAGTGLADHPPSLALKRSSIADVQGADAALEAIAKQAGLHAAYTLPDALAQYEDYFPGVIGADASTARHQLMTGSPVFHAAAEELPTAKVAFARARNYAALRGFARIGGVLIGLPPDDGSGADIVDFRWQDGPEGITLGLVGRDGRERRLGPFRAEIIKLALAYAADGRPIAATMPFAGVRTRAVLLHPALVDTALGCEARHLDQFAERFTIGAEDAREQAQFAAQAARLDDHRGTYRLAWAAQFREVAPRVLARLDPKKNGELMTAIKAGSAEATQILEDTEIQRSAARVLADPKPWNDPRLSPVTVKKDYFDSALVQTTKQCLAAGGDVEGFERCVAGAKRDDRYLRSFRWYFPPPEFRPESGVREKPYAVDGELSFVDLAKHRDDPDWPLRFMWQVTFDSAPYFAEKGRDANLGDEPFELAEWTDGAVARGLAKAPAEMRRTFLDMREFAVLQRLFRAALAGKLGADFPLDALTALQKVPSHTPPAAVRTLSWNVSPDMAGHLDKLDATTRGLVKSLGIERDARLMADHGDACPVIRP